jgi:hypothetical protein
MHKHLTDRIMMKYFVVIGLFLLPTSSSKSSDKIVNEMVAVELNLPQQQLRAGETGTVLIFFKPKKGIHITTDPLFELTFDTLTQFFSTGKTTFEKDKKEYLKTQQPVKQRFLVAKKTLPGSYRLKGTLIYYYCSDKEGWCSRFKQPVELTITVK